MGTWVVLYNGYGTNAVGDTIVYGPFYDRDEAEGYAAGLEAEAVRHGDTVQVEVEPIQARRAFRSN